MSRRPMEPRRETKRELQSVHHCNYYKEKSAIGKYNHIITISSRDGSTTVAATKTEVGITV
jgi:hypothetical protein